MEDWAEVAIQGGAVFRHLEIATASQYFGWSPPTAGHQLLACRQGVAQ